MKCKCIVCMLLPSQGQEVSTLWATSAHRETSYPGYCCLCLRHNQPHGHRRNTRCYMARQKADNQRHPSASYLGLSCPLARAHSWLLRWQGQHVASFYCDILLHRGLRGWPCCWHLGLLGQLSWLLFYYHLLNNIIKVDTKQKAKSKQLSQRESFLEQSASKNRHTTVGNSVCESHIHQVNSNSPPKPIVRATPNMQACEGVCT